MTTTAIPTHKRYFATLYDLLSVGRIQEATMTTTAIPTIDLSGMKKDELHKRYFATLYDLGIKESRAVIQQRLGLPRSTKAFTKSDYKMAISALTNPLRDLYALTIESRGVASNCAADEHTTAKDYLSLIDALDPDLKTGLLLAMQRLMGGNGSNEARP